jgi:hypothetical protein
LPKKLKLVNKLGKLKLTGVNATLDLAHSADATCLCEVTFINEIMNIASLGNVNRNNGRLGT